MLSSRIQVLDTSTAMKIAAGEVIDRPASAVRELIDNSLDAEATWISIEAEKGGREFLAIHDNGIGMNEEDLKKSYLNHATSKIKQFDDLMNLKTFGFRGEALASLAEIAELKISSRSQHVEFGSELTVKFGEFLELIPKGMNQGTSVSITEFFQNVPARLKFLGTDTGEYRAIILEFLKKALARPDVEFELTHNHEKKYHLYPASELFDRIVSIFPELEKVLSPFSYQEHGINIYGFVSHPSWYKPTRSFQYFFVNNRAIEWNVFRQQIAVAYNNLLPSSKFPAVFCYAEIDTQKIDFNVHPQKREIRFDNEKIMADVVRRGIRLGIEKASMIPILSHYPSDDSVKSHQPVIMKNFSQELKPSVIQKSNSSKNSSYVYKGSINSPQSRGTSNFQIPTHTSQLQELFQKTQEQSSMGEILQKASYVGMIFGSYLIFQHQDSLYLVDFHAMHERIRYEKIIASKNESIEFQTIIPTIFELAKHEAEIFEDINPVLKKMGFCIHRLGDTSFSVESVPIFLEVSQLDNVLRNLFVDSSNLSMKTHFWDSACKMIACKGSVKSGDALSYPEIQSLIYDWNQCENPMSCPHGRPIVITMSKNFFDKEFKRLGF